MNIELDDSLDEIEEVVLDDNEGLQPYIFEPIAPERELSSESCHDTDSNVDPLDRSGLDPSERCTCGNCARMPTFLECGCESDLVREKAGDLQCITQHEGFIGNCLNIHFLEASYYELVEAEGYPLEGQLIHETYRYLAYRRCVRWIFHKLPKNMRKVLPACVVGKIRTTFPSETYCGFKYPAL